MKKKSISNVKECERDVAILHGNNWNLLDEMKTLFTYLKTYLPISLITHIFVKRCMINVANIANQRIKV